MVATTESCSFHAGTMTSTRGDTAEGIASDMLRMLTTAPGSTGGSRALT